MTNRYLSLLLLLLMPGGIVQAAEIRIDAMAPLGMESLMTQRFLPSDAPVNRGPHGYQAFCYHSDVFVIYSSNNLGSGYELSAQAPDQHVCVEATSRLRPSNMLGVEIGMVKRDVEGLIGVESLDDEQEVYWLSSQRVRDKEFDRLTYANLSFSDDKLTRLRVFTTLTN